MRPGAPCVFRGPPRGPIRLRGVLTGRAWPCAGSKERGTNRLEAFHFFMNKLHTMIGACSQPQAPAMRPFRALLLYAGGVRSPEVFLVLLEMYTYIWNVRRQRRLGGSGCVTSHATCTRRPP